ncbi:palmitoyl-monogalactosyldiacylglycerol delta-7 desaturase, chloroplastic-like [Cynara cardunculus var. scolymus]|uniref:palmitoyl-monogalactosyldiacylglycerol delta-7 desaturase, chloroplastic-like n=1 Tax=Cynara cardunculus var. scolymus TaxID=59895 RepID=UPI000D631093|nr:palmitoyl-monogalactosyldiacylglycerol delta-7 desaturase, chloroplastic-like [Cynara cardunculus var. scolymus]
MRNFEKDVPGGKNEPRYEKILMSDVVVTKKRSLFRGGTWRSLDIKMALWFLTIHLLTLFAPFTFTWGAFWTAFVGYVLSTMFGISISYHRNLAHRSFKLPKWLEYSFAYIGVQTAQRDPIYWVSIHRYHHQYVDKNKDAHSPIYGLWFSHMGWLFDSSIIMENYQKRSNVEDLKSQSFYRFIKRTYVWHVLGFAAIVYALGGFPYLVWVIGVRLTCTYHVIFMVNSVCHTWRKRSWKSTDLSKNNWWMAILSFGEGWHNNHHAFESSAKFGLEWWQFDFGWCVIRFLEALGLATNVKLPTEAQKLKKSLTSTDG